LVTGAAFQRVTLPPDSHRGGFLTHASVLKVTANGTSTSPVKRGAWVLSKIYGAPPSPPPSDVPAVEPDVRGTVTIRDQLAKHRSNQVCASCHSQIDPPGFALESYDVIGGFRERYRGTDQGDMPDVKRIKAILGTRGGAPYRLALPIDCSGETVAGKKFANLEEFKRILLQDPTRVVDNIIRQLLMYGTGAPVGFADRPAVAQIVKRSKAQNYGVQTLILEAVQSPLFKTK
jgi:hypothetical protein